MQAFESGAVRESKAGKGRPDLIPLSELAQITDVGTPLNSVLTELGKMQDETLTTSKHAHCVIAMQKFLELLKIPAGEVMNRIAVHYERGAEVHGVDNWKKGIPTSSYIGSAMRHLFAVLDDKTDEDHAAAFMWNMLSLAWTYTQEIKNKGGN